jgi:poly-gamma-glutamate capsule biosynthesis protein CapA/YwtB (metallophosphatase superfamily)
MSVLFRAVGDIGPNRPEPGECFALVADLLREADLTFCQLECNITERGERLPQVRHTHRAIPAAAQAIRDAGLQVVCFASNHCMDWGAEGFFDTIERLEQAGCQALGVGKDIAAARRPVIREIDGVRTAFVAACSILPPQFWADEKRPGCVPMRAHTVYEQIEIDQPGTPARIHSFAFKDDLAALVNDVRSARTQADVVIVSLHWGIHFIPATIADYQTEVAHALIDAGADLILGHHAHILKGVEVYRGKPIFYSVGNFAIDLPMTPEHAQSTGFREIQALSPGWEPDFASLYNFPPDSRMTMIVEARLKSDGIEEIGFRPAFINRDAQPEPLTAHDARFGQIVDYMRWCTTEAGLNARYEVAGDLVVIR